MPAQNLHRENKEGIYCHIYNRGVEKRVIFDSEADYEVFLGFLKDYLTAPRDPESIKKEFSVHGRTFRGTPHLPKNYFNKVELIAYNLMPDHFHLLLHQKTRGSLENFIRSLCTRYSMYYNKKYQRTGALFEGPYKSIPIKAGLHLLHLTHYLHNTDGYSSYPEYLGERASLWVKTKVVQSFFDKVKTDLSKKTHSYKSKAFAIYTYKDFVEKYELDQKEKEFIDGITFDRTEHLERRDLTTNKDQDLKPRSRIPEFLAASAIFLLLVTIGIRNIMVSTAKSSQPLPTSAVLSETKVEPKIILTIKSNDGLSSVNIRQKPTTNSQKVGKAKDGDTFEFVSMDKDWYEVKLLDGSTGFISATYAVMEETNN